MSLQNNHFLNISNSIMNNYIKETDKKIVGYYCTYIPEELLHAAKLFPFRIRATGNKDTDLADIYMVRFTCSFVRSTLHLALQGVYDFLDGFVVCNSCDHSRRMFELFDLKVFNREGFNKKVPRFYLALPHIISNEGFEWYKKEIEELKQELEISYNIDNISNENLIDSIKIHNENRKFLREIHNLRVLDAPKINGSEALQIFMANSSVPKEIANQELENILNLLRDDEGIKTDDKRIMLIGSVVDNIDFTQLVESSGSIIVSDFLCFGTRYFQDDVEITPGGDPIEDISKRLYYRMSCPRMMDDHERRLEFVKNEIKRAKIDGVLLQRINNCDLFGCENMLMEHELKDLDIPVFNIDRESFHADTTRLQTRIEAFIEMIT